MTPVLILILAFVAGAILWLSIGELVLVPLISRLLRFLGHADD